MPTLFTRIINQEIPSYKIYEDEYTYAFLDINPLQEGQTLIVPKIEVDHFFHAPEPYYQAMFATVRKLCPILRKTFNAQRIAVIIEGFEINHCHIKLIPANTGSDLDHTNRYSATHDQLQDCYHRILIHLNQ